MLSYHRETAFQGAL